MMLCILFLQLTELLFTCCYACFVTKFPNFKGPSHSPKVLKNKTLFIMVIMLFFFLTIKDLEGMQSTMIKKKNQIWSTSFL